MSLPLAPHHLDHTVQPTPDVLVGGVWAISVLSNFSSVITVITGLLAAIYYGICIYDNLKKKFHPDIAVTKKTVKKEFRQKNLFDN